MKIGLIIVARLQSQRLKKKHLQEVLGRPIFSYLIDRVGFALTDVLRRHSAQIIIATADEVDNRKFEEFANNQLSVFYGAAHNIPLREYQAALDCGLDAIVSIDGDDILCSVEAIKKVAQELGNGACYVATAGLPIGLNCFGYSTAFLQASLEKSSATVLETGWGRIFDSAQLQTIPLAVAPNLPALRFTLDYPADFDFFRTVIEHFADKCGTASDEEIIDFVVSSQAYQINQALNQQYDVDFNTSLESEKRS